MSKTWKTFEENVRELAAAIWGKECKPLHIGGVDLDGAIETDTDVGVFLEMTERRDLAKVREDVQKLLTAKTALAQQTGAFARCFCIVDADSVTNAMVEAGKPHSIRVLSFKEFSRIFFDFSLYKNCREKLAFGSAINPLTGRKDDSPYVKVKYTIDEKGKEIGVNELSEMLMDGTRIVLLGEYGSGKSRCHRELFRALSGNAVEHQLYPIAIDLRESWGLKRGMELIRRHLEDIGADELQSAAIRALNTDCLIFLFDGFDEIGSQSWSNDSDKLRAIRAKSLEGVKDLVSRTNCGVLISGREHYFNNNSEIYAALGLNESKTVIVRCKFEFTEAETHEFFSRLQAEVAVPNWLPRRPLICQTIADLSADELDRMFGVGDNEIEFWDHFVRVLCERDARIRASFDAATIERILMYLARTTRTRSTNVGPITLADVQAAFQAVVGETPVEEASVMLQRLPGLGRVKAESNDRQFIDMYILDGLRAKDVVSYIEMDEGSKRYILGSKYVNPLGDLGQRILSNNIDSRSNGFVHLAKASSNFANVVLACDIVASLLLMGEESVDFEKTAIHDGHFIRLDMSKTIPLNLTIEKTVFGSLLLPSSRPPGTSIRDSLAERVFGVVSAGALPIWIQNLEADQFDSVESVSRIRKIGLDPAHEVLVAVVRKTFFQKGSGRKEEALLRGLSRVAASAKIDKIVNLLVHEQILTKFKGEEGWVYAPNRAKAGRMRDMLYDLRASNDPIWQKVSEF